MTDPKGAVWTYTYDVFNRQIGAKDPLDNETSTTYDELGRVVETRDPLGRKTSFTYDALGRLTQVKDALGGTAQYTSDKVGNRLSVMDPRNQTTTLTYDALNRLATSTDPLGHTYTYTYDAVGNRTRVVDANGATVDYEYDVVNRLTAIRHPDATSVTLSYDANGNLTQMVDAVGTTTYAYDTLNRTTGYVDAYGKTIGYEYDAAGNRTGLIYPDGKRVAYTFDANNRMATVTDWGARVTRYTFDERGVLTQAEHANGTTARYTYDAATRLLALVNAKADASVISSHAFALDKFGNRTGVEEVLPLAALPAPVVTPYTYDQANQIQTAGLATFSFDYNGNMTAKTEPAGTTTFTWDVANRLKQLTGPSTATQYVYNGAGTRLARTADGQTTRFVIDPVARLSQLLVDTNAAGTPTGYYVYGLGLTAKVTPGGAAYQYHFDPIGSTTALTDANQAVVNTYAYTPFGEVTLGAEGVANPFTFDGRDGVFDEGNGLLFARARYYAPDLGRFLTRDPVPPAGDGTQGFNPFAYVENRPTIAVDPEGRLLFVPVAIGVGAALGAGSALLSEALEYAQTGDTDINGRRLLARTVGGAVGGGIAASGAGLLFALAGGAASGAVSNTIDQSFDGKPWDWSSFGQDIAISTVSSGVGYGVGRAISRVALGPTQVAYVAKSHHNLLAKSSFLDVRQVQLPTTAERELWRGTTFLLKEALFRPETASAPVVLPEEYEVTERPMSFGNKKK